MYAVRFHMRDKGHKSPLCQARNSIYSESVSMRKEVQHVFVSKQEVIFPQWVFIFLTLIFICLCLRPGCAQHAALVP